MADTGDKTLPYPSYTAAMLQTPFGTVHTAHTCTCHAQYMNTHLTKCRHATRTLPAHHLHASTQGLHHTGLGPPCSFGTDSWHADPCMDTALLSSSAIPWLKQAQPPARLEHSLRNASHSTGLCPLGCHLQLCPGSSMGTQERCPMLEDCNRESSHLLAQHTQLADDSLLQ